MDKRQIWLSSICFILAFCLIIDRYFEDKITNLFQKPKQTVMNYNYEDTPALEYTPVRKDISSDPYVVYVNPPVELSGKTKAEIYDIRRSYVEKSIFDSTNYKPSNSVFGEIIDGKPWYSANFCRDNKTGLPRITGPSEESRFINNPTMLVALEYPFLWRDVKDMSFCVHPTNQLLPRYIAYSKSKNEITVAYYWLPFDAQPPFFYQFNGLNAADLGYKYAYVDMEKSTFKPDFTEKSNNLSTDVQKFKNFIHLGFSCEHESGCNNGSPRQPNLEFNVKKGEAKGEIYIKLWKSQPSSVNDKPDITEKIVIGF